MDFSDILTATETKYGLPKGLLHGQMMAESGGNPNAVSKVGAQGLMQFMPETAKQYGIDPLDPHQAIDGAGRYMRDLIGQTPDLRSAVAAYNWGIGNLKRQGIEAMPQETRDYIAKVTKGMKQAALDAGKVMLDAAIPSAQAGEMPQIDASKVVWDAPAAKQAVPQAVHGAIDPSQVQWDDAHHNEPSMADKLAHQAGLTARHIIEGGMGTIGLVSDPVAAGMNALLGTDAHTAAHTGKELADWIGLPAPENATERVVSDMSKTLVGTGGLVKGAAALASKVASPVAHAVAANVAVQPGMQAASAIGSAGAGGAMREAGGGDGAQFLAALAGGVSAPGALALAGKGANAAKAMLANPTPQQIDNALAQAGITLDNLPSEVQQTIRSDVAEAFKTGKEISPDAMRRLADYRSVGATPTRSTLTLNPVDVTRERNLAKIGANSSDPAAQQLAMSQNSNNATLIRGLNELGADTADDAYTAGRKIMDTLGERNTGVKSVIDGLYANARATNGRSANLDPHFFTNRANDLLDEALLGGKLPADVRNLVNKAATGEMPLTVDVAEQLKTRIGDLQRATTDKAERMALGLVRNALDDTPLIRGQEIGQDAINAFNAARRTNAKWMRIVDRTPSLVAIRDGMEPDRFVQQFITGSNVTASDLNTLQKAVKHSPETLGAVRGQILAHLKNRALNGAADEVGNFSPAAFNKALKDIGREKLKIFFGDGDIEQLRAIGRVASYEKFQPAGSAVNNSNTAAASFSALVDKLLNNGVVRKIPFGSAFVANPAQDVATAFGARNALNAGKALTLESEKATRTIPIGLLPAIPVLSE